MFVAKHSSLTEPTRYAFRIVLVVHEQCNGIGIFCEAFQHRARALQLVAAEVGDEQPSAIPAMRAKRLEQPLNEGNLCFPLDDHVQTMWVELVVAERLAELVGVAPERARRQAGVANLIRIGQKLSG